ncbi:MAG: hypothetical protein KY476_18865 [Planctomycetes bacterium]|nr:hypothetical protein [Planctomycetota bacterium]
MLKRYVPAAMVLLGLAATRLPAADGHFGAPSPDDVRSQVTQWVAAQGVTDKAVLESVASLWALDAQDSARTVFDKVVETFALVDEETNRFVAACTLAGGSLLPPDATPLLEGEDEFYASVMRQFYARHLVQRKMLEEALVQFAQLDPAKSIDPAGYFFFKAVAEHQLLLKEDGLKTIATLLDSVERVPVRYETTATLMRHELEALKPDTLDEVARKMTDVERQLELARAGMKVQKREDEIIATLDDIIEKLEQSGGT